MIYAAIPLVSNHREIEREREEETEGGGAVFIWVRYVLNKSIMYIFVYNMYRNSDLVYRLL